MLITGHYPALVTPFNANGKVDFSGLKHLIAWHLQSGVDGFVVLGTTAESAVLSERERIDILTTTIEQVQGRVKVIVGTGCNDTMRTISRCQQAVDLGADACLVVTPYYNRPNQIGLLAHYQKLFDNCAKPIMIYNVPSRTGVDLHDDTVVELFEHENCLGIKAADGDSQRILRYLEFSSKKSLFSGDDRTAFDWLSQGGHGVISVVGNLLPGYLSDSIHSALRKEKIDLTIYHDIVASSSWATNPIPIKYLLKRAGKIDSDFVRLPLVAENPDDEDAANDIIEFYQRKEIC